jgi:hypothetical protein
MRRINALPCIPVLAGELADSIGTMKKISIPPLPDRYEIAKP